MLDNMNGDTDGYFLLLKKITGLHVLYRQQLYFFKYHNLHISVSISSSRKF
jgi:hypothetical protein